VEMRQQRPRHWPMIHDCISDYLSTARFERVYDCHDDNLRVDYVAMYVRERMIEDGRERDHQAGRLLMLRKVRWMEADGKNTMMKVELV